jgi:tRNA nucleotidyltransferase/poly(A) polymerase
MASRYGRPVYLVGGALTDVVPRDIDVRVVLSASEFEARFGDWRDWNHKVATLECDEGQRRWHIEIAKMNKQGSAHTNLPVDFQVQALPEAMAYVKERRQRLDDIPELVPPWED